MSNWSRVIVAWSGVDEALCELPNSGRDEIDRRVEELRAAAGSSASVECVVYPCGADDEAGMACETLAVIEANHFNPRQILGLLCFFEWECPEEVQLLWKDEEMDQYENVPVFAEASA